MSHTAQTNTALVNFYGDPASISDLCDAVTDGELLPAICARLGLRYAHVVRWIAANEDRQRMYEAALAACGDRLACECLEIADAPDAVDNGGADGPDGYSHLGRSIQHRRLQISTRLTIAARWFPARYADRGQVQALVPQGGTYTIEYSKEGA